MAEYKTFASNVQVSGEAMAAFVNGFPSNVVTVGLEILNRHGIGDPRAGEFYPLQAFLDAMKEIAEKFGAQMLFRIGEGVAASAKLPPGLDSLEACLASIDTAYHMNHKGGEIGRYIYSDEGVQQGLHRAKMVCSNPYPCSFDLGCIEGFAKRFKPSGSVDIVVRHDETQPCRKNGADSCAIIISWT